MTESKDYSRGRSLNFEPDENPNKPDNPKHAQGSKKPSTVEIPGLALLELGAVMKKGADEYGSQSWVDAGASTNEYLDALNRHLLAWKDGQDADPKSGHSHLAHIMACCAIMLDCQMRGSLLDNRVKDSRGSMVAQYIQERTVKDADQ